MKLSQSQQRAVEERVLQRLRDEGDSLAAFIDHTLLRPEATELEIRQLCDEAWRHGFATVCVQPRWVSLCARQLAGSAVGICSVVAFPHGANATEIKAAEAKWAVDNGATELDMVVARGPLRAMASEVVQADIRAVVEAAPQALVKVILESSTLSQDEKQLACTLVRDAGAHFVKTSTGFGGGQATLEDVRLLREMVGPNFGVKASGGIRDRATALAMLGAGANRIGTSSGLAILS